MSDSLTPAEWGDEFLATWPVWRVHPLDAAWIAQLDVDLDLAQRMLRVPLRDRPWPGPAAEPAKPALPRRGAYARRSAGVDNC